MSARFNPTSARSQSFCHANNDISAPLSIDRRQGHIPDDIDTILSLANDGTSSEDPSKLQCCCGRSECAYLANNNMLLGGIERDLETAARLGQALLTRHESYVNESQVEHDRLTAYIGELESERLTLQSTNGKIVEENRLLLSQLESANVSLKESDSHVKSLEALLRDCEVEVRRLGGLTRRTEELEIKILDMEKERLILSQKVDDSREETRSTIKRWKESEIKVRQLEHEVQRIEWEAKKDKERHEEIIARLDRERVIERELGGAEGRLKGAAAVRGLKGSPSNSTVVSHFVRDILQDNANLQAGIAELRELLQSSNEEVQSLREQILQHQPVADEDPQSDEAPPPLAVGTSGAWAEPAPKQVQPEVHVHHHYHGKATGKRDRTPSVRKLPRRRAALAVGGLPSTPESSTPTTPFSDPLLVTSSPVLPISLHRPPTSQNRWSAQSAATGSSMLSSFASSPRSYYEPGHSLFDHFETGQESSRPTSPESAADVSASEHPLKVPPWPTDDYPSDPADGDDADEGGATDEPGQQEAHADLCGSHLRLGDAGQESQSRDLTPRPSQIFVNPHGDDHEPSNLVQVTQPAEGAEMHTAAPPSPILPSRPEKEPPLADDMLEDDDTVVEHAPVEVVRVPQVSILPSLRRTGSQDSLLSISGMDIHLAKRPNKSASQSASFLTGNRAYFALSPSATRKVLPTQPLAMVTELTALSSPRGVNPLNTIPTGFATANPSTPETSVSVEALSGLAGLPTTRMQEQSPSTNGLGRLVGGWVRGKWGITPMKSSGDLRAPLAPSSATLKMSPPAPPPPPLSSLFAGGRLPGINQAGTVPGFKPPKRPAVTGVQVNMMDEQGLRESLAE